MTQSPAGYYRIVESYRNDHGRICHRTLLTVGFIDYDTSKLASIQQILNDRMSRSMKMFDEYDTESLSIADAYWHQMVAKKSIDDSEHSFQKSKRMIDIETIKHRDVREIGSEWMCFQALEQLKLKEALQSFGWDQERISLALTQIISRAVYPYSEYRTQRWIKENSAVCEITQYPVDKITKDKLYKSALDLYEIKGQLEGHLSTKTNELFDIEDKIVIYDLTNTYFEGRKVNSKLAQYGRSKEQRSDCKIVVLAMVINVEGFIKYSNIFEGNKSDSATIPSIIDNLRVKTSDEQRAIVVIDAGIASEDNLRLLKAKGYDYVCVNRAKIKASPSEDTARVVHTNTKSNQTISLQRVVSTHTEDYILRVSSPGKEAKERSMKNKFTSRFIHELTKIKNSLSIKNGTKTLDKVNQRIGRAIEKYPSAAKYYNIEVKAENNIATDIVFIEKETLKGDDQELGAYYIRTSVDADDEVNVWNIYNTIREVESTIRCLKTDLELRPIYHKNDKATLAHLHLGILAYWLVNTIRYQLKQKGINHSWTEIIRITNTQKIITTSGQNKDNEIIYIRRCSEPSENVNKIYTALNYKKYPFIKRKSVVPKSEQKKIKTQQYCITNDD